MGTYEQRSNGGQLGFKFDPKNLEIRSKTVELTLEPLVTQVSWFFWLALFFLSLLAFNQGDDTGQLQGNLQ